MALLRRKVDYTPIEKKEDVQLCDIPLNTRELRLLELLSKRDEVALLQYDDILAGMRLKRRGKAGMYRSTLSGMYWLVPPHSS